MRETDQFSQFFVAHLDWYVILTDWATVMGQTYYEEY